MSDPRSASRAQALAAARTLVADRPGATVWIGIDGPGGAGKSSLAGYLAAGLPGAAVVAVDDFSGPRIAAWDWTRFRRQVLLPLRAGRPARYQRWDWDRDAGGEWRSIAAGRPVIVEGVSATRAESGVDWALRIWVETSRARRLQRIRNRDGLERMPLWLQRWLPSEDAYFAAHDLRARADLVLSGEEVDTAPDVGESTAP